MPAAKPKSVHFITIVATWDYREQGLVALAWVGDTCYLSVDDSKDFTISRNRRARRHFICISNPHISPDGAVVGWILINVQHRTISPKRKIPSFIYLFLFLFLLLAYHSASWERSVSGRAAPNIKGLLTIAHSPIIVLCSSLVICENRGDPCPPLTLRYLFKRKTKKSIIRVVVAVKRERCCNE